MNRIVRKGITIMIMTLLFIMINNMSYCNLNSYRKCNNKNHSNCMIIEAKTAGLDKHPDDDYDFDYDGDNNAGFREKNEFHIIDNKYFSGDKVYEMPRVCVAQGVMCLEHGKDANFHVGQHGSNSINKRVHIEGNTIWFDKYGAPFKEDIKEQKDVKKKSSIVASKIAYLMDKATYAVCNNANRRKKGIQGAIWLNSHDFMTLVEEKQEGHVTNIESSPEFFGDECTVANNEANNYATSVEIYAKPEKVDRETEWNWTGSNWIIGPIQFTFAGQDNCDNREENYGVKCTLKGEEDGFSICNKNGTRERKIESGEDFWIKVPDFNFEGGRLEITTKKTFKILDGYVYEDKRDMRKSAQRELFAATYDKVQKESDYVILKVPIAKLKIKKTDEYTKDNLEGFTFVIKQGDKYLDSEPQKNYATFNATTPEGAKKFTTNSSGETPKIEYLKPGTYQIVEIGINEKRADGTTIINNWQYEIPSTPTTVTLKAGDDLSEPITNKKTLINLSGKVFEDNQTNGKEGGQPGIYDNKDKVMQNIKVTLINKNNGEIIQGPQDTKEDGSYIFKKVKIDDLDKYSIKFEYDGLVWTNIPPTQTMSRTNAGSKAKEKDADRTNFNNGFATVVGNGDDTGKTIKTGNGDARNLYYDATVFEKGKKSTLKKIYSDENGKIVIGDVKNEPLKKYYYPIEADTETAKLNYFNNLYNKSANNYSDYKNVSEIGNNNLGLMRREQPDISLVKDIENIKISINGESQVYKYKNRYENLREQANSDPKIYDNIGVKFGSSYGTKSYTRPIYQSDYKFESSEEDKNLQVYITYCLSLRNQTNGLITTVNSLVDYYDSQFELNAIGEGIDESNGEINNLLNLTNSNVVENDITNIYGVGNEKKYHRINIKKPIKILPLSDNNPNPEKNLYIRFKLTRDKIKSIIDINTDDNSQNDISIDNIAEITSYSAFDLNNKVYAGIDPDSNPGNATPGNMKTYEDDTDKCTSLRLEMAVKRQMLGNVFEDKSLFENDQGLNTGEVREGNGIFDNSENTIKDVIVTYKEAKTGTTYKTKTINIDRSQDKVEMEFGTRKATEEDKTKYKISNEEFEKTYIIEPKVEGTTYEYRTITETIKNGNDINTNYCIADFIPGNYKVTYTWGDKEHTVQNWKATIFKKEREDPTRAPNNVSWNDDTYTKWYNEGDTRFSDAKDNYETRRIIDSETIYTKYNQATKDAIQAEYESPSGKYTIKMDSTSPGMQIGVEKKENLISQYNWNDPNLTNVLTNIDFGIIQRPKQILKLEKSVKSIKTALANGQLIVNALIKRDKDGKAYLDGDYKNVTYMEPVGTYNGTLKLELDNELIQGCKLDVEYGFNVRNISELDYADEGFYIYGTKQSISEQEKKDKVIRLKPKAIVDYLDKEWSFTNQQMGIDGEYGIQEGADINNGWIYKELQELQNETGEKGQLIDSNVNANDCKVLYTEYLDGLTNENIRLAPENNKFGEISGTEGLVFRVSKLLSNTDEIELDNNAEIVSLEKTSKKEPLEPSDETTNKIENGGGAVVETTPGNFNPAKAEQTHEADDAKSETTVVTPATGENRNYIIPIGIGIIALITLGVGVVIIKKKTLTK